MALLCVLIQCLCFDISLARGVKISVFDQSFGLVLGLGSGSGVMHRENKGKMRRTRVRVRVRARI